MVSISLGKIWTEQSARKNKAQQKPMGPPSRLEGFRLEQANKSARKTQDNKKIIPKAFHLAWRNLAVASQRSPGLTILAPPKNRS